MKKTRSLRCPICKKIVLYSEPEFPFCSERCRSIDLGRWASGAYVIPAPLDDVEELLEHPPAKDNDKDNDNDNDDEGSSTRRGVACRTSPGLGSTGRDILRHWPFA